MAEQEEQAGCGISAVGSLSVAQLRLAGAAEATTLAGDLEILSLSGTLCADGIQLHIAVADVSGAVIGGHLATGLLVRTTAELVLHPATGYAELQIYRRHDLHRLPGWSPRWTGQTERTTLLTGGTLVARVDRGSGDGLRWDSVAMPGA